MHSYKMFKGLMRYPRTTQEIRSNQTRGGFLEIDEYRIKIRGKRSHKRLPSNWDDLFTQHAHCRYEPWKRLRKTQYK